MRVLSGATGLMGVCLTASVALAAPAPFAGQSAPASSAPKTILIGMMDDPSHAYFRTMRGPAGNGGAQMVVCTVRAGALEQCRPKDPKATWLPPLIEGKTFKLKNPAELQDGLLVQFEVASMVYRLFP